VKCVLVQKRLGLEVFLTKYVLIIKRTNAKEILVKRTFFFSYSFFNFLSFSFTALFMLTY